MTHHQLKYLLWSVVVGATLSLTACMKWDYGDAVEDFNATGAGLFITNEGNFQYGNATLSYYDPSDQTGAERNLLPCQRHEARRRGTVDDHLRQQGLGRGEQLPRDFRHRPEHLQGGGTHRESDLAALYPFPERRESLRHPIVGQPHLHHQSEEHTKSPAIFRCRT